MKALVTGATGFVGRRLVAKLGSAVVLSRNGQRAAKELEPYAVQAFDWEALAGPPPPEAFADVDAVFHLAGEAVGEGRWTAAKKTRIRDSRETGTRHLVAGLRSLGARPRVLVSASAVGYYGSRGEEELTEGSLPGNDFLADVCIAWEREAEAARELGMRVTPIRIGVVLGPQGGALAKMMTLFSLGLGSPLGSGRQYMSWIHVDDLVELMLFAARQEALNGPINGTAPAPVTNREFTRALARALKRPAFMPPAPGLALKLFAGEFAEVLLASQRALPRAALEAKFRFQFIDVQAALDDVVCRWSKAG
jgi:uncharacterized protein (TIGR01777 family)